jgi:hypothetical protein
VRAAQILLVDANFFATEALLGGASDSRSGLSINAVGWCREKPSVTP